MFVYNLASGKEVSPSKKLKMDPSALYFFHCSSAEIPQVQDIFNFDPLTLSDCMNFDESIRMNSFPGYDFISLIYFRTEEMQVTLSEINFYVGKNYIVLISQASDKNAEKLLTETIIRVKTGNYEAHQMNKLYYTIFDMLLTEMRVTMEQMEDEMNQIENALIGIHDKANLQLVSRMRGNAYIIKKQIRPLLYIGDQLLVNENELISKDNMRYFKNIDVRINKLHDFSMSLQEYANELLHIYESQMSTYTNDIINKLTVITLFFAPLTVISGIYGMNFINMPELQWVFGYPFALCLMLLVSLIVFLILKWKKWL